MGIKVKKHIILFNGQNTLSVFYYKAFFILLLCSVLNLNAQSISGTIYNDNKETVSRAIVTLLNPETDETVDYVLTNDKGFYILNNVKTGSYKLSVNAIGYNKIESDITITGNVKNNYNLKQEKEQKIEEVILTATKPIKIKSDTIEMNAKSFMNGTEKNVEDLLKKLPGVTVESDGKITVGGKEIEKIMVENDDFFEKGYTLLTKNMSVKPIDKVQILQNYSNNKLLKGVENSEKVAINLTLEEGAKRDWFGNADLSSAIFPESYYLEKITLTKFGKNAKYFLLGSTNTIGVDNLGDINHLIRPTMQDEPGFINVDTEAHKFGVENFIYLPFGSEKAKFNNDKLISANAIFNLNKKMKLKIMSLGSFEKSNFSKFSTIDYNLGDKQFTNTEDFYRNSKKTNYFNKLDFEYDISKKMVLKYSGNINYWKNNKNENQTLNSLPWNVDQRTDNHSIDSNVLLTNKINDRLVWLNGIRFLHQKISDNSYSDQFFFDGLFMDYVDIQNFKQASNSKIQFLGVVSQLLYRTENENLWDFSFYNHNTRQNFSNIMGFEKNSIAYFLPDDYKNNFKNNNNDFALSLKQTSSFGKFKINPQLDIHYVSNKFENELTKRKEFFYLIPTLNVSWAVHDKGKINSSLFLSRNSTSIIEMLPNNFSENPRNLVRGINNFDYLKNSGASLKYIYGNWNDRVFINLYGSYTNYQNYLTYNYKINQEYTSSDLLLLKNRNDYLFSTDLNYYLKAIRSNFKILYTIGTSQYKDQVDDSNFRNVFSSYSKIGFQLKSGWKKNINYSIGTNLNISKITTDQQKTRILNQQAFLELLFVLNEKTKIEIKNNYYSFNGYFNKDNSYNFLDFKLNYQYDKNISFSLIGNNLFNTKKFREVAITSYSTYTTEYSLFPRYIMLEVIFSL
ncbi:carboxypeptidase-like regulatory domain-containing protein [Chryseobacterium sp. SL1]|uniref:carboxypeptidase-like regulatory domain-containing protein n=1 Tax=Chryseobacterium sp. SL1 TaxID=2995159 RepID=UPI002272EDA9|nr:carboxypeptidase-like regulatory domain-containing protein [Chryseobacterium sp. SL1]MCY1661027.1 carboxypeptidase-like regulatory domain-containing protein [Chryseobacterium sp. SL1]